MLSPNMAPWHVACFQPKKSEKMAEAGRALSLWPPAPSLSFFPDTLSWNIKVIKPFCERGHPYTQRKGTSLSLSIKGHQGEESWQIGLTTSLPFTTMALCSLMYCSFPRLSTLGPASHECTQVLLFLWVFIFVMETPVSPKICIKSFCLLFSC